ncbi:MAG: beta strand repeat-containing protein, partial [Desulfuromonadaceae bacterium]
TGTSTVTAGANAITLNNAGNALSGAVSLTNSGANNAAVTNTLATTLGASTVGQNLILESGGTVGQVAGAALTVGGTSGINAGANAITLTNAGNSLSGAVSLTNSGANNAAVTNTLATTLGASTVGQNLTVVSGGAVSQAAGTSLAVAQNSTITAGSNAITLTNDGNALSGVVSLTNSGANNAAVTNSLATTLGASTVGQNLTLVSGGAVSQAAGTSLTVAQNSTITAGSNAITLTNDGNALSGVVNLTNNGANDVSLTNSVATVLGNSSVGKHLTVLSGGKTELQGNVVAKDGKITINTNGSLVGRGTLEALRIDITAANAGLLNHNPFKLATFNEAVTLRLTDVGFTITGDFIGDVEVPFSSIDADGLVRYNNKMVGGKLLPLYQEAQRNGVSAANTALNAKMVEKMLDMAKLENFFSTVPKDSILDTENYLVDPTPMEFIVGAAEGGVPCILLDKKSK